MHQGQKIIEKQEKDLEKGTASLKKENDKLMKLIKDAGNTVKMTGNVQHFAETLEREFLILEETVRLANDGWSSGGEDGSWSGSYYESEDEGTERGSLGEHERDEEINAKGKEKDKDVLKQEKRRERREEEWRKLEREEKERERRETTGTFEERMRAMELDQISKESKTRVVKVEEGGPSTATDIPTNISITRLKIEDVKERQNNNKVLTSTVKARMNTDILVEKEENRGMDSGIRGEDASSTTGTLVETPGTTASVAASQLHDIHSSSPTDTNNTANMAPPTAGQQPSLLASDTYNTNETTGSRSALLKPIEMVDLLACRLSASSNTDTIRSNSSSVQVQLPAGIAQPSEIEQAVLEAMASPLYEKPMSNGE